ncbi:MAG: YHS domain-containing protein [Pseudomonadota bacterium]
MNWLTQNWVVVVVVVAIAWLLLRRGGLHGHGHGHGLPGAGARGHGHHGRTDDTAAAGAVPEAAVDPVSGEAVRTANALSSIYQGHVYYFSSTDNRARFEAAPQEYAQKVAGYPVGADAGGRRSRHHGGC